ncbi:hypothetical protein LTS12_010732 [Elasticomyces elasticus]|nr:hypothetical protein LTS12_010732 [Elasticomyces elasticus]
MQLTTTQISTQPASTATITQYTTLGPSTVTTSSIYVTYTTQTTSTSPAARATTSSASLVRPAVALRSPTVIAGNTVSVASQVEDAKYTVSFALHMMSRTATKIRTKYIQVVIPFALTVYGVASSTVTVSSNGVLGLGTPLTTDYNNSPLPQYAINGVGIFPCWDDLLISVGTPQGVFYGVDGTAPNRAITFEWYTSHYGNATFYYHFLASFWENMPNVTTFDYLNMSDSGVSATTGIEAQGPAKYAQYSNNQAVLTSGKIISFNNSQNIFTVGYPPGITAMPGTLYS